LEKGLKPLMFCAELWETNVIKEALIKGGMKTPSLALGKSDWMVG